MLQRMKIIKSKTQGVLLCTFLFSLLPSSVLAARRSTPDVINNWSGPGSGVVGSERNQQQQHDAVQQADRPLLRPMPAWHHRRRNRHHHHHHHHHDYSATAFFQIQNYISHVNRLGSVRGGGIGVGRNGCSAGSGPGVGSNISSKGGDTCMLQQR